MLLVAHCLLPLEQKNDMNKIGLRLHVVFPAFIFFLVLTPLRLYVLCGATLYLLFWLDYTYIGSPAKFRV